MAGFPANVFAFIADEDHLPMIGTTAKYSITNVHPTDSVTGAMKGKTFFQYILDVPFPIALFDEVVYLNLDTNEVQPCG